MELGLFGLLNEKFKGKKTYITSIIAVLTAVAGYLSGEVTLFASLELAFLGVFGSTLRSGVSSEMEKKTLSE